MGAFSFWSSLHLRLSELDRASAAFAAPWPARQASYRLEPSAPASKSASSSRDSRACSEEASTLLSIVMARDSSSCADVWGRACQSEWVDARAGGCDFCLAAGRANYRGDIA